MKLNKISATGSKSSVTVSDQVFAVKVNPSLLTLAVRVYLSNLRQGTSKAKTRGEINRTKKKWYKQKGTGNARHGARSANIFVGGGVAHGPKGETDWTLKMSATMKKKALQGALTVQVEKILVSDAFNNLNGKTKEAALILRKLAVAQKDKVLVLLPENTLEINRSLRNVEQVLVRNVRLLNTLDVLTADKILMTSEALKKLEERLA